MYVHAFKNKKLLLFGGFLLLSLLFFSLIGGVSAAEFNTTDSNVTDDNFTIDKYDFCSLSKKDGSCHMMKDFKELNDTLTNQININVDQSKEIAKLKDDNKQLNSTVERLDTENKELKSDNIQLKADIKELKSDHEKQINELKSDIKELKAEKKDLNDKLDKVLESNEEVIRLNNKLNENNAKLVVYYANWCADNATQQAEIKRLTVENKDLREKIKNISDKIEELNKKLNRKLAFISGNNLNMNFKDGSKYSVKLTDRDDFPVPSETVVLTVNGVTYNVDTDANGIASLPIALSPGTYTITATHGRTVSNTIRVQ